MVNFQNYVLWPRPPSKMATVSRHSFNIGPYYIQTLWSYGNWIYNYLCNQCLSPLKLWVRSLYSIQQYVVKIVKDLWQVGGLPPGPLVSSTNKTDHQDITEILLKVALNTIKPNETNHVRFLETLHESPYQTLKESFSIYNYTPVWPTVIDW